MNRISLTLAAAGITLLASGCPKQGGPDTTCIDAKTLQGVWKDQGGATYQFDREGRRADLVRVVDYDDEDFEVLQSGCLDGVYTFVYRVPSTGYVVTHTIGTLTSNSFTAMWDNNESSGTDEFDRQ